MQKIIDAVQCTLVHYYMIVRRKNVIYLCLLFLASGPASMAARASLDREYSTSRKCNYNEAQFNALNSPSIFIKEGGRYFVADDGYWYHVRKEASCTRMDGRLNKETSRRHNTCYFGTTLQCMMNIVTTKSLSESRQKSLLFIRKQMAVLPIEQYMAQLFQARTIRILSN